MIQVKLPDGSARELDDNASVATLAALIGPGLAKAAVVARVNGVLKDLSAKLADGDEVAKILAAHLAHGDGFGRVLERRGAGLEDEGVAARQLGREHVVEHLRVAQGLGTIAQLAVAQLAAGHKHVEDIILEAGVC